MNFYSYCQVGEMSENIPAIEFLDKEAGWGVYGD
jgi:hypothetical protein